MPDTPSLQDFESLLREHHRWNRAGGGAGTRLDLSRRSLHGLDLRHRDLGGAILVEADLSGCDLTGVDLARAQLTGADLRGARMIDADLYKAQLEEVDATGADLSGARLLRTDLPRAVLTRTILDRTQLAKTFFWRADLTNSRVHDATMEITGFDETVIDGADFTGSTGTVGPGSTVRQGATARLVDAVTALNAAGARVREFQPR